MVVPMLDPAPVDGDAASVAAWQQAWANAMHFVGDSFADLEMANVGDPAFAMGSVFGATYRLLGGMPADAAEVAQDLERARRRARSPRALRHVEALEALAAGNTTEAGELWDEIAAGDADFAAVRFAHDIYLHVGDVDRRVRSSERAAEQFRGRSAESFVSGQFAFALEEAGAYEEAERLGWQALDADPLDLWALHALAHVYESLDDQDAAIDLLESRASTWTQQDGLAVHVHWHHALRLIAAGQHAETLALFDRLVPDAQTPFRLGDLASLLWRLELAEVDVGDRWDVVVDRYAARPERHTVGFLDLHMALGFARRPNHPEAASFFSGVTSSHLEDPSENGETFRDVVVPLVEAIRMSSDEPDEAAALLDSVAERSHRIGGSIAQRELLTMTRTALEPVESTGTPTSSSPGGDVQ